MALTLTGFHISPGHTTGSLVYADVTTHTGDNAAVQVRSRRLMPGEKVPGMAVPAPARSQSPLQLREVRQQQRRIAALLQKQKHCQSIPVPPVSIHYYTSYSSACHLQMRPVIHLFREV